MCIYPYDDMANAVKRAIHDMRIEKMCVIKTG